MIIRQSTIGNADICLRRMQYDLETPRDTYHSGVVRAMGTAYHADLEHVYQTLRAGGTVPNLIEQCGVAVDCFENEVRMAGENFQWNDKFPTQIDAMAVVSEMISAYQPHIWRDWEILGIELSFDIPWGPHMKHGTMDLALRDPHGWIYGVDHKTAGKMWPEKKSQPRANNQAPFYSGALRDLFPGAPGYGFIFDIMTYGLKFERRVTYPTVEHIANVEDKAIQVASLYEGMRSNGLELPTNASSNLCSEQFCDFWDVCPAGSSAL